MDHFPDYIELKQLEDTLSETVIQSLKNQFATHGIPCILISDNGPQYSSSEFAKFSKTWGFKHQTCSPLHSQGNVKAESAVKIMKGLIKKAKKEGEDPWLAVLEWRNTPTTNSNCSPTQKLFSRRTRSSIPTKDQLLEPKVVTDVPSSVVKRHLEAKKFYDKGAKSLPELYPGEPVKVKPVQAKDKTWSSGVCVDQVSPRSYKVKVGGNIYRRNRIHLKSAVPTQPVQEETPVKLSDEQNTVLTPHVPCKPEDSHYVPRKPEDSQSYYVPRKSEVSLQSPIVKAQDPPEPITRSRFGRKIQPPKRLLDEYV